AVTPAPPQEKAAPKKGGVPKKAAKGKKGQAAAAAVVAAAATVTATPAPVEPASPFPSDPIELITAALNASSNIPQTTEEISAAEPGLNTGAPTFAEMNAVPMATGGRRRPGANLAGFKDMAKTMKGGR
ncbi:hypothetical protein IQ266_10680, partial [filamentous cyanobacterium LEGE 11480]